MQGDYQSQRNLAYSLASGWPKPATSDGRINGCAWYLLILRSGSTQLNGGDVGNVKVYCDKLSDEQRIVAERKATKLYRQIYVKR